MNETEIQLAATEWASEFESALRAKDRSRLENLFGDPAYYRDNGALSWDFCQFHGREAVISTLMALAEKTAPRNFRLSAKWLAPHLMGEGEDATVEAFFDFETEGGLCVMILNAEPTKDPATGKLRAKTIFTRLEGLKTIDNKPPHPRGRGYTPSYPGETWKQNRDARRNYEASEPEVVIIGAGQSGLATAAFLRRFGVDVVNIDRYEKVGDSWNKRYESLSLHNPVEMNAFPFLPFPPHYPEYLSKDLMGEWLDIYARYMDLNVWTSTEFCSAKYDAQAGKWNAVFRRADGTERLLHPKHIVMATGGIGGKPSIPQLPGLNNFAGIVLHSSEYTRRTDYDIKKAIIIGVATSAHDIARDLTDGGVDVTMFQRGPVVVNNVNTANLAYAAYIDPNTPTELVDVRFGPWLINPLREKGSRAYHKTAKQIDADLLQKLAARGLRLGDGVNEQGWFDLFFRTGGGYYLNTGTSELIVDGKINIEQFDRVVEFTANGVKLDDGSVMEADLIVLATGYQSRKGEVADFFGNDVAERVGEIARLDEDGEWKNMWSQTAQRGLWFNGGGINQMRPGSERLALLIKADLDGLIPDALRREVRMRKPVASEELIEKAG